MCNINGSSKGLRNCSRPAVYSGSADSACQDTILWRSVMRLRHASASGKRPDRRARQIRKPGHVVGNNAQAWNLQAALTVLHPRLPRRASGTWYLIRSKPDNVALASFRAVRERNGQINHEIHVCKRHSAYLFTCVPPGHACVLRPPLTAQTKPHMQARVIHCAWLLQSVSALRVNSELSLGGEVHVLERAQYSSAGD